MSYDSTQDILEHIARVEGYLSLIADQLRIRAARHDQSKLQEPEKSLYDEWTPKLCELTYGSDEYKAALKEMGPALQHHYRENSHHPEHYPGGVTDMSLLDIIEMLCDWQAASGQRGGNLSESLKASCQRFGIDPQLGIILANTAEDMGWIDHR
jgi:hypothetical protein